MARIFVSASNEYLYVNSAPVTTYPFTFAGWVKTTDNSATQVAWNLCDKDVGDHRWFIGIDSTNGAGLFGCTAGGATKSSLTSTFTSNNTWHHVAGVGKAGDDRDVYLDAGGVGNNGEPVTPANVDRLAIGAAADSSVSAYWNGNLAECALWNVVLTPSELAELATGVTAWQVRPENLVFYAPLIRSLNDEAGGLVLTANGTTVSNHPPIIEEGSTRGVWAGVAAPPVTEGVAQLIFLTGEIK